MLPLSDCVVELISYEGMSADQCDVRQSILRRRSQYDEAKKCIRVGLAKNPEKAHTHGLLHVGLAEIYRHESDWQSANKEVQLALVTAEEAEEQDPRQAARIYRRSADILERTGGTNPIFIRKLYQKAQALASATGARDQLLKI